MTYEILHGDCRTAMQLMNENTVDSIVTDPPYGLEFMGKGWDRSVPGVEFWVEALRVLKPGGYLVAFSGTRTYHRMACAIEDAGFEMRDQLAWVYGSGFPKSHNGEWGGTALKPAWEPIVLARKALVGTVEANWLAFGTGALNISGCRVPHSEECREMPAQNIRPPEERIIRQAGRHKAVLELKPEGRWPANFMHDGSEEVVALFPQEAGAAAPVHRRNGDKFRGTYGAFAGNIDEQGSTFRGDSGSAARFFYCPKATRTDRDEGCAALELKPLAYGNQAQAEVKRGNTEHTGDSGMNTVKMRANTHPTVKPTALMQWLCRLVTPRRGGLVLDPFAGSGSTGKAAVLEGFDFIGCELSEEYVRIANARIAAVMPAAAEDLM